MTVERAVSGLPTDGLVGHLVNVSHIYEVVADARKAVVSLDTPLPAEPPEQTPAEIVASLAAHDAPQPAGYDDAATGAMVPLDDDTELPAENAAERAYQLHLLELKAAVETRHDPVLIYEELCYTRERASAGLPHLRPTERAVATLAVARLARHEPHAQASVADMLGVGLETLSRRIAAPLGTAIVAAQVAIRLAKWL